MKVFAVLSFVSVAFAGINVFEARNCAGNNCNRAITGTRAGLPATSIRRSDCSSFQLTVVTPSPVTSTTWVDATTSVTKAKSATASGTASVTAIAAVTATAAVTSSHTVLPTYATHCSSAAAYASACSCWGITPSVSTAATPTVTITSTYDYCEL